MHGVLPRAAAPRARYEILHGNELLGVRPGTLSGKATDHAYVVARIQLRAAVEAARQEVVDPELPA